jgi:hypothetical protein
VTEVWHFRDETISIDRIDADGSHVPAESSKFLFVRPDEVTRWFVQEDASVRVACKERLAEWVQTAALKELRPLFRPWRNGCKLRH